MQLILLAVACLSVQFFAKHAGHNTKKLPYDLVGLGGLFFLLTSASGLDFGGIELVKSVVMMVAMLSPLMGWLCLLVATFMGVLDLLGHFVHHQKLLPH
jgi:hypothetical protein